MYFVRYVIRSSFFFREPAHSHTDKFQKNLGTLKSYNQCNITRHNSRSTMFVWVPQFETEKAKKNIVFLIQRSNIYSWNLRAIPTFSFHYPLSIRTGGVGCETIGSIRSESKSSFDFREFLSKFFVEFFRDSSSRFWDTGSSPLPTPTRIRSYLYYFLFYHG